MILQPITLTVLTATVVMVTADTPIPTGTVSFYAIPPGYWTRMSGATETLIGTAALSSGLTAHLSVTMKWGNWGFAAVYNGDSKWAGSTSGEFNVEWGSTLVLTDWVSLFPASSFGAGGWLGGMWGTVGIPGIGATNFGVPNELFAWGGGDGISSIYAPLQADVILVLMDYPPAPTVWELRVSEVATANGLPRYGWQLDRVGLSPVGTYGQFTVAQG